MPPRVYVVDDDRLVTTSLSTALQLETDWAVTAYNSAVDALAAMATAPADVVLSDLKMPGLDGIAFLKQVRARTPTAVLLLLTGYADKESAVAAINEVGLWQYVEKPWDTADLILKVRQGLERRDLLIRVEAQNRELAARVAELEVAREQLLASERLAAVGRVMAGLAHEMGNQLGLIGYAEVIAERTADPDVAEFARAILRAQKRLGAMIAEIKDFVRSPDGHRGDGVYLREVDDLAAVVEEAVALLRFDRDAAGRTVELSLRARPVAQLHRGKIMQAVINLARNAVQASPEGAVVNVTVDADADGSVVRVVDHGAGMTPEVLARIGEPFFTTRSEGTGLGLGITRRIVEEHGGTLRIASQPGQGTEIALRLPLAPPASRGAAPVPTGGP